MIKWTHRVQISWIRVHWQWMPRLVVAPNPSAFRLVKAVQNELSALDATVSVATPHGHLTYAVAEETIVLISQILADAEHSSLALHRQLSESIWPVGRVSVRVGLVWMYRCTCCNWESVRWLEGDVWWKWLDTDHQMFIIVNLIRFWIGQIVTVRYLRSPCRCKTYSDLSVSPVARRTKLSNRTEILRMVVILEYRSQVKQLTTWNNFRNFRRQNATEAANSND